MKLETFFKGRANPPQEWIDASHDRLLHQFRTGGPVSVDDSLIEEEPQKSSRPAGSFSKWKWFAVAAAGVLVLVLSMQLPESNKALSRRQTLVINGQITDYNGNALAGLYVELSEIERDELGRKVWRYVENTETDDRGRYRIAAPSPGEYYIRAHRTAHKPTRETSVDVVVADPVPITVGQGSEVVADIKIAHVATYKVRGRIERPSNESSLPSTQLSLVSRNPGAPWEREPQKFIVRFADAGASEEFELRGVPPGRYDLYVNAVRTPTDSTAKVTIDVRDRDLEDVRLAPRSGTDVKGRVVLDGPEQTIQVIAAPAAPPVSSQGTMVAIIGPRPGDLHISLEPRDGFRGSGRFTLGPLVDETGRNFTFPNVPAGEYDVTVSGWILNPFGSDLYLSDIRASGKSVLAGGIHIGVDAVDAVEVVIRADGATVEGNIDQKENQDVQLLLFPEAVNRNNASLFRLITNGANLTGKFVLRGIAPGRYKLIAITGKDRTLPLRDPRFLDALVPKALDLTLTRGSKLSGLVVPLVPRP